MNYSLGGPTDATVEYKPSCVYSGSYETDVVWFSGNLPGGVRGRTYCDDIDNPPQCDQAYATLDEAEINVGSNDEIDTTFTACHELGHTVGLTHGSGGGNGTTDDCMANAYSDTPSTDIRYQRYSTHHRGHINA